MSIISCLDGLVDTLGNCNGQRTSGVMYLDDIGVSLQDAMDGNDLFENGRELVSSKIGFAQQIIKNDVMTYFNGRLSRNSVLSNGVVGYFRENKVSKVSSADELGGIFIEVNKYPYIDFYLHKVRLLVKEAVTFDLKIYDCITGQELYSQSVTTNAEDYTDVVIDQSFKTQGQKTQLLIAYPKANVTAYSTQISNVGCGSCLYGKTYDGFAHRYGAKVGASEDLIKKNIDLSGDTNGMSIVYSLNCSLDNFVCSLRNRLQYALLHLVGAKIMEEITFSKNQNSTTLIFRGDAETQRERFQNEYDQTMFGAFNENGQKIKKGLLDQLALPNDVCFKCKPTVKRRSLV